MWGRSHARVTFTYIPKHNLLSLCLLLVRMFSGLAIWHWTAHWCALPGGGPLATASFPWWPVVLCGGLRPHGLSLPSLACLLLSSSFSSHLCSHIGESSSAILKRHHPTALFQSFHSLCHNKP